MARAALRQHQPCGGAADGVAVNPDGAEGRRDQPAHFQIAQTDHRDRLLRGSAKALQSGDASFETLHAYFLDRLVPVCAQLLDAAATAGEIRSGMDAYELMRGVGSLCIGADNNPRYDARRMVDLLIAGLCLH